jgi:hypothetical protein
MKVVEAKENNPLLIMFSYENAVGMFSWGMFSGITHRGAGLAILDGAAAAFSRSI